MDPVDDAAKSDHMTPHAVLSGQNLTLLWLLSLSSLFFHFLLDLDPLFISFHPSSSPSPRRDLIYNKGDSNQAWGWWSSPSRVAQRTADDDAEEKKFSQ